MSTVRLAGFDCLQHCKIVPDRHRIHRMLSPVCRAVAGLCVHLCVILLGCLALLAGPLEASAGESTGAVPLTAEFEREVAPRLLVPPEAQAAYTVQLQALVTANVAFASPQFILLIDRSANVQAALLYWGSTQTAWQLVGAAPVSTGLPGRYEHFVTPLGVFEHTTANPDFRAEGTKNKLGFRGYGRKDMRIYDLGWVAAPRGWGDGAMGKLRLQMHATDPDLAEPRLGTAQSEGCIRIPATLNDFIDRHGLLDADYEGAPDKNVPHWVLRADRTPTATPGRFLVVVDSESAARPVWSPRPATRR